MPTVFTHALAGAVIGGAFAPPDRIRPVAALAAAAAVLPDADALGLQFGIRFAGVFGHRGITHSLLFAVIVAAAAALVVRSKGTAGATRIGICLFAAMASHGLLDALTNGGGGVAFFAPFDETRYFFPVTPIRVAPIRAAALFTERGAAVMASEFVWVWIPALAASAAVVVLRTRSSRA